MSEKLPFLSKTGYFFIVFLLLCFAFVFYDRPTGRFEVVKGVITQHSFGTSKNGTENHRCVIKLGNGISFIDYCKNEAKVGDLVNVCIQEREIRGVSYYTNGCLS